jgi:signal transduction histidine kinase
MTVVMTRSFRPRYFLASILLLLAVVAVYASTTAIRTQRELSRQLEEKGAALAEALETSSRSAIRGNALMEEMIAQRLIDNARLIDRLLLTRPLDREALKEIAAANRLSRVELLDSEGRPYAHPQPRGMMGMMMRHQRSGEIPESHREMMMYMWGRRWARPPEQEEAEAPPAVKEKKFWEGSLFGVAVGARSFPGIIAIHADADYVLNFRKEIGVERQIEELSRQSGIEAIALLGPDLTVLAHSEPGRIGSREDDAVLREALGQRKGAGRLVRREGERDVFEVVRPLALDGSRLGLLRIDLSTAPMKRAWRRDVQSAAALGLAIIVAGALGMGFIFYVQQRHLREVRALEAQVEQRERLSSLGNLAAAVGHEVRNPLNAISMGLQRLRAEFRPAGNDEEFGRFVELMQGEVKRLNGIVEEFLSLARPIPLKPVSADVGELLREVAALVEADAASRRVRITVKVLTRLPQAMLDRDQMKQVLLNLIRNGIEAMPGGGELGMAASSQRDSLNLIVEDEGEGVPADLLPRIFEPYVTSKAKGLGLGLAIAKRIVEAHGGRIEAESSRERGSRFTITLPL